MESNSKVYQTYVKILQRELVPAMGCTEPIAIAYCAAMARSVLGAIPDRVEIIASGNIIKNVKSVIVPNTNGRKGIAAAAAIGILGGDENAQLEVIAHVPEEAKAQLGEYLENTPVSVAPAASEYVLDVTVTVYRGDSSASVRAVNEHTNLVHIEKDHTVLKDKEILAIIDEDAPDYNLLTVKDICDFADSCDLEQVAPVLKRQIRYNSAIAEEGMSGKYGAAIGQTLIRIYGDDVKVRAKARAAAASDARMNGCELPVVITSGSGNQGLTASLPVIEYAKEYSLPEEKLLRALVVSNLITLHAKQGIGRLSAYCGAVSAGAGAGAGIAYLLGGDTTTVSHTIVNALAITSGIVCDGAKSSCAAKIATSVDAGILGFEMYRNGHQFYGGDGLVVKGVENSIYNFSQLGRVGMKQTDREIIRMMTKCN
ncbi:serine dehydratase subunit alpha family protein [Subdoligranulum variabile]|uniref:L-cysteine desulfidase family protein n=1 Tax=Subdoligranulum variabile TaxID=214851 RepID=UPI0026EF8160|nr:L-serine ammonia-lyase, iron-sulfur-dependent, subunit alpha [Subdoligranulum variabile]